MMSSIFTVCRKEILDNSRDKRTLWASFLFGPLFGPVFFVVIINFMVDRAISSGEEPVEVPVVGAQYADNLVAFLASQGIVALEDHGLANMDAAVNAVRDDAEEVVVLIDDSFGEDLASGAGGHVSLVYDDSNTASGGRVGRIRGSISAYSGQIGGLRLLARGIDPSVVRPLIIDNIDVSTADARGSRLLGVLTYFLMFAILFGGLYLATDTTAGERERKSLEPLLATPVPRSSLLLGKMAATAAYMLLSLVLTLASFTASVGYMPFEELGMGSSFDPGTALIAFLLLIPFAPFAAALMTLVASFTKSYKEAQSYLGLVIAVPTLPLILASVLNVRPSLALMAVPSLSQHLLVTNLIRAEPLEASMVAVSVVTTLLLGALLAYAAIRLYERERILG